MFELVVIRRTPTSNPIISSADVLIEMARFHFATAGQTVAALKALQSNTQYEYQLFEDKEEVVRRTVKVEQPLTELEARVATALGRPA